MTVSYPRRARVPVLLCLLVGAGLASAPTARAWGFRGHRLLNRKAAEVMPQPLRPLFAGNVRYLAEHSIDPDLWREASDTDEEPNHFINLDAFGEDPFPGIPRDEAQHLAKHGAAARAQGRVPWRVDQVYRELVDAYRAREPQRILERAAVLGHYVGDAHVPLHAVLNHDGQLTGQHGLHSRWETELVSRHLAQLERTVTPRPAQRIPDPLGTAFDVLRQSFREAGSVLASDRAATRARDLAGTAADERYDDAYYSRLFDAEGGRVDARLEHAATMVASLWLSAWLDAGKPQIDTTFRTRYVRGESRVILASLDGASATILDAAVARGVMPHLARLRAAGATARGSLPALPIRTAAAHAALFSGAWSDVTGIGGNTVPLPDDTVLASNDGYDSTRLRAEPIWVTAARQGLDATVAQATQVYPFAPYLEEARFGADHGERLSLLDGFAGWREPHRILGAADVGLREPAGWTGELPPHAGATREVTFVVEGREITGLFYDDPADPVAGFDTLYLGFDRDAGRGVTLKPSPARGPDAGAFRGLRIPVGGGSGTTYFRLFSLAPDGSQFQLLRSGVQVLQASRPDLAAAAYEASGGFVGNSATDLYERGALGPQLWAGGDGTAESRYLETAALALRQMLRVTDFAARETPWSLLVAYFPEPDSSLHMWLGLLDPALRSHDPALAARVQPFVDQALGMLDKVVGALAAHAGPDTALAIAGDHGMVAADRTVKPNALLRRAGLLALDASGRVDLAQTRIVYHSGNSGALIVNSTARPSGIVPPAEDDAVRALAAEALLALRDPRTGAAPVTAVRDAKRSTEEPTVGGPGGGDLYLTLAPGYSLSADLQGEPVEDFAPKGVHFADPRRREMQVAFTVSGGGVAAGVDLGHIRQIDIAPTLCALLGIDPPAQATGRVLTEALAEPPAAGATSGP